MTIQDTVKKLVKKYQTNNPYELAKCLNIMIIYNALGSINGYYTKAYRQKFIVLNDGLSYEQERFTLAHEIGHSVLHPAASTPFFNQNTFFSVNKLELEANRFALELLLPDDLLLQYESYTTEQIARLYGLRKELIELRTACCNK